MPILTGGGSINPPGVNPGTRQSIYSTEGVPTDANIGLPAGAIVNGMLCQNVLTGFLYERRAGAWVRCDTV
jgi:hypothetical protein